MKRTNWTTEEVIDILKGQVLVDRDGNESEMFREHNNGIRDCIDAFGDFLRPKEELGAMAYDPENKIIYHIGDIPEEMMNQKKLKYPKDANSNEQ